MRHIILNLTLGGNEHQT